jgi:hypothetical protein
MNLNTPRSGFYTAVLKVITHVILVTLGTLFPARSTATDSAACCIACSCRDLRRAVVVQAFLCSDLVTTLRLALKHSAA